MDMSLTAHQCRCRDCAPGTCGHGGIPHCVNCCAGERADNQLAAALEALAERCFDRCLFPAEVRAALAALDAHREALHVG